MQKANYRKYAIAALTFLMVGTFAACSGASSQDEALTHPGSEIGTVQFDVNPSASSVTVTPVGSPWSSTQVLGDGSGTIPNVTITSSNVSYAGGVVNFDVKLTWSDPDEDLWNVRLETNATTDPDVVNLTDDRCLAGTPWGTCLAGANPPAVTFVSDNQSEGPESKNVCDPLGSCATAYRNNLNAGCGQISTHWSLSESSGVGYKFWATLYGDKAPIDPMLDPRYDQFTATQWYKVRKVSSATNNYPGEGADSNSMLPNEWFFVHLYADAPGNNQAYPFYLLEKDGNGNYLAPQHIEDTGNIAAYQSGSNSTANFFYVGKYNPYTVRFDNAVVETLAKDGGLPPTFTNNKFNTARLTKLYYRLDPNGSNDGWVNSATDADNSSNTVGYIKAISNMPTGTATFWPNPCANRATGVTCPAGSLDGLANANMDYVRLVMHVKTTAVSGQTSYILPAFDSNTGMAAYVTGGTYSTGDDTGYVVPRSLNWPNWCELMPGSSVCWNGSFNLERQYICIQ